jgi:hypothetical protein
VDHGAQWADLDDRFFGASVLIERSSVSEGFATLDSIFREMKPLVADNVSQPAIMVEFWPICHRIDGICRRVDDYNLMYAFLRYFRDLVGGYVGRKHPLFELLDALSYVEQRYMMPTLRLGYMKAIRCLESLIGADHAIVLNMWSNYVKYWDNQSINQEAFAANFTRLVEAAEARFGRCARETVRILHSFLYAMFYSSDDKRLAWKLAEDLVERTGSLLSITQEIKWGVETLGFAFASKVLALLSLDFGERDSFSTSLDRAIRRLKTGDRECRTRAIMLSEDLETKLAQWGKQDEVEDYKRQRLALLETL